MSAANSKVPLAFAFALIASGGPMGCQAPAKVTPSIQSPNANERIIAIRAAAESGDKAAIPLIVDRLEDEDSAVRFYAILALDRMTGQRFGYDYGGSLAERDHAVEKWRDYVRRSGQPPDLEAKSDRPLETTAEARSGT